MLVYGCYGRILPTIFREKRFRQLRECTFEIIIPFFVRSKSKRVQHQEKQHYLSNAVWPPPDRSENEISNRLRKAGEFHICTFASPVSSCRGNFERNIRESNRKMRNPFQLESIWDRSLFILYVGQRKLIDVYPYDKSSRLIPIIMGKEGGERESRKRAKSPKLLTFRQFYTSGKLDLKYDGARKSGSLSWICSMNKFKPHYIGKH